MFGLKRFNCFLFLIYIFSFLFLFGCGIFRAYERDANGFYPAYSNSCGPVALELAFCEFYKRNSDAQKEDISRDEISKTIQQEGITEKEFLSLFNREAVCITWPSEIKRIAKNYGFELVPVNSLSDIDVNKDVAIVLLHGRYFSRQYHWSVYPIYDVKSYYGNDTVIDKIYLVKLNS